MKTVIANQRERVAAWVSSHIGRGSCWSGEYSALGLEHNGELVAGVVVDGWVPGARCTLHCAGVGKNWLNRAFLFAVFDYCFIQLGCKVIVNTVSASNADSIRFTEHIGFTEVCRIADAAPDSDLVVFALYKADCRWLNLVVR